MQIQYDLVPQPLHPPLNQFLHELEQLSEQLPTHCPHCTNNIFSQTRADPLTYRCRSCLKYFNPLTGTPFNRLTPASWLTTILTARVNRETYQAIAEYLDCSIKQVTRRDKAIMRMMQSRFPALHLWYQAHNDVAKQYQPNTLPDQLTAQHLALKQKITVLLEGAQAGCLHYHSFNTVRIGHRTAFRCKDCRRSFNLLSHTPLNRLRHADKWLMFIDLLVAKKSNRAIAEQLGLNSGTMGDWRRKWYFTLQQWDFNGLATWCRR